MSTTVARPPSRRRPQARNARAWRHVAPVESRAGAPLPEAPISRHLPGRWAYLAGIMAAVILGVGIWAVLEVGSGSQGGTTATAAPAVAPDAFGVNVSPNVPVFQLRLQSAGYDLGMSTVLDPVTRSAAADFLRLSTARPLVGWLAAALEGTVLTGRRDATAWNRRFGLHRITQMVERPLTGAHGQLDDYGNVRSAAVSVVLR